jgi:hypothetical protein
LRNIIRQHPWHYKGGSIPLLASNTIKGVINMYLGIIFGVSQFCGDTFSLSREVEEGLDVEDYFDFLAGEAKLDHEDVDRILIVGPASNSFISHTPEVIHMWSAANGDFEFYGVIADHGPRDTR